MSRAFYPNWDVSARPVSLAHLREFDSGQTSAIGVPNATTTTYEVTALHFSGGTTSTLTMLPGFAERNIILYGINVVTTSPSDAFAIGLFPEGEDYDTFLASCTAAGPIFLDFAQPVVLPKGRGLLALVFAAGAINFVTLRYGIANVAGA